ncbi:hypothetical protein [Thermomonospora curvata]|uniref:Uncharacterized protein n=1 Tax=Thermomonospora curvata (strain ATCC 19995 / DSM 43183 / JCM 3096 / KCTC 9072 / NBRC 15933 / NCIMB 10081 / Henssen B9) TaxID=471852 RepID=D1A5U9_THECD|nr:hypothetical protein [Thermomonospora curvata]ACY98244.1 hypothetical protein Tcur_2693 [Thermomonospora curvata DSM 43183]
MTKRPRHGAGGHTGEPSARPTRKSGPAPTLAAGGRARIDDRITPASLGRRTARTTLDGARTESFAAPAARPGAHTSGTLPGAGLITRLPGSGLLAISPTEGTFA